MNSSKNANCKTKFITDASTWKQDEACADCHKLASNKLLRKRLEPHGCYEAKHTPGLWKHQTRPVTFTLVVNDFGIQCVGKQHAEHLIQCLEEHYELETDWTGGLHCGINLEWSYDEHDR